MAELLSPAEIAEHYAYDSYTAMKQRRATRRGTGAG